MLTTRARHLAGVLLIPVLLVIIVRSQLGSGGSRLFTWSPSSRPLTFSTLVTYPCFAFIKTSKKKITRWLEFKYSLIIRLCVYLSLLVVFSAIGPFICPPWCPQPVLEAPGGNAEHERILWTRDSGRDFLHPHLGQYRFHSLQCARWGSPYPPTFFLSFLPPRHLKALGGQATASSQLLSLQVTPHPE